MDDFPWSYFIVTTDLPPSFLKQTEAITKEIPYRPLLVSVLTHGAITDWAE
jgi:hypothetical protein